MYKGFNLSLIGQGFYCRFQNRIKKTTGHQIQNETAFGLYPRLQLADGRARLIPPARLLPLHSCNASGHGKFKIYLPHANYSRHLLLKMDLVRIVLIKTLNPFGMPANCKEHGSPNEAPILGNELQLLMKKRDMISTASNESEWGFRN